MMNIKDIDPFDEEDWNEVEDIKTYYLFKYIGDTVFLAQIYDTHSVYLLKRNKLMGNLITMSILKPLTKELIEKFNNGDIEITPVDTTTKRFKLSDINDIYEKIVPVDEELYSKLRN